MNTISSSNKFSGFRCCKKRVGLSRFLAEIYQGVIGNGEQARKLKEEIIKRFNKIQETQIFKKKFSFESQIINKEEAELV